MVWFENVDRTSRIRWLRISIVLLAMLAGLAAAQSPSYSKHPV